MEVSQILEEINLENGSNYKKSVLQKYKDNEELKRVLKMTYDKVTYSYYVTMKNVKAGSSENTISLNEALDRFEFQLSTRKITGNAAIGLVEDTLESVSEANRIVIRNILNRDQRINLGKSNINRVWKNLIVKPPYERCDIGTSKNISKNIDFNKKVYSEVKMDGTYRSCSVAEDIVFMSRPGNEDKFPLIKADIDILSIEGYVLIGEMTLLNEQNRNTGNGIINSITERENRQEDIRYTVWDMIPMSEYSMTKDEIKVAKKAKTLSTYEERFNRLQKVFENTNLVHVNLIEFKIIKSMREAYEHFQEITARGDEGTVIKAEDMTWEDGTSKKQLKVKLSVDAEVRCIGFIEGTPGTKREKTFGSMVFENDEGTIAGSTSGFTDILLEDFNSRRKELIGKVFTVQFNDITKARNSKTYAFSHPRFQEFRDDKDTTDTLERCLEMKEMAMNADFH